MNVERVNELADHVEKLAHVRYRDIPREMLDEYVDAFSMEAYIYPCGTPACSAGHAQVLFVPQAEHSHDVERDAADALGIDAGTAIDLFRPDFPYHEVSPVLAAAVLRDFARTGLVRYWMNAQELGIKIDHLPRPWGST